MRIFLDTNVLISAFISHGACSEVFEQCLNEHTIYSCKFVIDEFEEKLIDKFDFPEEKVLQLLSFVKENAVLVTEAPLEKGFCKDPDDDHILAGALSANADCIITGDKHLLSLKKFHGMPIIHPGDFWRFEDLYRGR